MINLGIIGPGRIVKRVMTDIPKCKNVKLTAIASRDITRAKAAAETYGAPLYFGSYEEMAQCPDVDLVYIATPNNCHLEQACLMMNHSKHVICEKPLAMNGREAAEMAECARRNGVFLMEAMWTRFMPAMLEMKKLTDAGIIGEVRHVFSDFSCVNDYDPESRLFLPELGGGVLLDLGVYPLMAATLFLGWKPSRIQSLCLPAPSGVDMHTTVTLSYEDGKTAQIFTSADADGRSDLILFGTKGTIHACDFWHCERFTVEVPGKPAQVYEFPRETEGHRHEFDHAALCIREGRTESPVMTLEESIAVSDIMTGIRHDSGIYFPGEL